MQRPVSWLCVVVLLLGVSGISAADKNPGNNKQPTDPIDAEKVLQPGSVTGTVQVTGTGIITLRVNYQRLELKPGANTQQFRQNNSFLNLQRHEMELARLQQQMMNSRNPWQHMQQIQRKMGEIERDMAALQRGSGQNPYRLVNDHKDIDIHLADDVKYRRAELPLKYDDKGMIAKYTKEEEKELKGDPKLPGYEAKAEDVTKGAVIKVTLAYKKVETADKEEPEKDKEKEKDKDKEKTTKKLMATMILIEKDGDKPTSSDTRKKPKK
jgi:hypothetical protein